MINQYECNNLNFNHLFEVNKMIELFEKKQSLLNLFGELRRTYRTHSSNIGRATS